MGLNKSTGNMYEFITHTWNTIKGECPHGCTYCYMHRWGKQNPVRFDKNELKTDLSSGNFIFVGSSCDMFAYDIPDQWINETLEHCKKFDNKYLFQSKNPGKFFDFRYTGNTAFCTTIETYRFYKSIMNNAPDPMDRAGYMSLIFEGWEKYVTIEPIMDFDLSEFVEMIARCEPKQVNIGADTGKNCLPEPEPGKILSLIEELSKFTIVYQKNNLQRILK